MRKNIKLCVASLSALALLTGLSGCSAVKKQVTQEVLKKTSSAPIEQTTSEMELPEGFPDEIPIYTGAEIIDADNFNENNYTLLYNVKEDYSNVAAFYVDAFSLDSSYVGESEAYFEGFDVGNIHIKGLTIEDSGDGINVFITLRNDGQETSQNSNDSEDSEEYTDSDIMTYQTAKEVTLDSNYPSNIVPIYPDAKVIGCSIVPGTSSGFVDLLLPPDAFEDAVAYYTDELGLEAKSNSTTIQKAVQFKGEIDNHKVVVLISHLLSGGNDPFVQITVNEQ